MRIAEKRLLHTAELLSIEYIEYAYTEVIIDRVHCIIYRDKTNRVSI